MSTQNEDTINLVKSIVVSLVDEPEQVQVTSSEDGDILVIGIHVDSNDIGKVIGRQGRIIKAIRTLARAASAYVGGAHIEVEVMD